MSFHCSLDRYSLLSCKLSGIGMYRSCHKGILCTFRLRMFHLVDTFCLCMGHRHRHHFHRPDPLHIWGSLGHIVHRPVDRLHLRGIVCWRKDWPYTCPANRVLRFDRFERSSSRVRHILPEHKRHRLGMLHRECRYACPGTDRSGRFVLGGRSTLHRGRRHIDRLDRSDHFDRHRFGPGMCL